LKNTFQENVLKKLENENNFLRVSTRIIIFQFVIILFLIIAILLIFPLKEKVPYFVQFNDNINNFVYVQKANQELQTNINLTNQNLVGYIKARETINGIDDDYRKEIVKSYSSKSVFNTYLNAFIKNKDSYKNLDFSRKASLVTISNIKRDVAIITFKLTDIYDKKNITERLFRITILYKFENLKVNFKEANINPLGLIIKKYNIEKVK
jgi:type IV secretion system protein VirB8